MNRLSETIPTNPLRVKGFVKYFNNYLAALFIAVIPVPIANWTWVPIVESQRHMLATVTPIFCFLTLGFLFFFRHALAGPMFPEHARRGRLMEVLKLNPKLEYVLSAFWQRAVNFMPLILIVGAFWFSAAYYSQLVLTVRSQAPSTMGSPMGSLQFADIPGGGRLLLFFIMAFVCAEAAFVWMALKEYLQDVLGLTDAELLH